MTFKLFPNVSTWFYCNSYLDLTLQSLPNRTVWIFESRSTTSELDYEAPRKSRVKSWPYWSQWESCRPHWHHYYYILYIQSSSATKVTLMRFIVFYLILFSGFQNPFLNSFLSSHSSKCSKTKIWLVCVLGENAQKEAFSDRLLPANNGYCLWIVTLKPAASLQHLNSENFLMNYVANLITWKYYLLTKKIIISKFLIFLLYCANIQQKDS